MARGQDTEAHRQIVSVVLELLQTEGYDAVQLRVVAKRAHVSLTTVYKLFATRDELIVRAIQDWMADEAYAELEPAPPGETTRDSLMRVLRVVFEPWERQPRMLEAYHYARQGPCGQQLDEQGLTVLLPVVADAIQNLDPGYLEDVTLILGNVVLSLIGRFATGAVEISTILPTLERAVYRLTADNAAEAAGSPAPAG
ncbi:TetR family transcriptional regulator [Nocardia sp. NPDC050697]|uniref:TetR family transcriptional regulator n=1 Tax=Nocardia sp. NPDC050697 TaxID=3155158 RepID=UPI0033DD4E26